MSCSASRRTAALLARARLVNRLSRKTQLTRFLLLSVDHTCCRYAKSDRLRKLVNLVVVGGVIDPEDTGDREERAECEKMHGLVEKYNLKV
jgi:hypothetical protein